MSNKKRFKDIMTVGFALFSMFFGAGNLLFPPYLGLGAGKGWPLAFLGFLLADSGLSVIVIIAMSQTKGDIDLLLGRAGKMFAKILGASCIICIGPLACIPRTAATTYEMAILPNISGNGSTALAVITSAIFFVVVYLLSIRPAKVLDIIGNILTPTLMIFLLIMIVKGVINPLGVPRDTSLYSRPLFGQGFSDGYLTMDPLGAAAFSSIVILTIIDKGYKTDKEVRSVTIKSGLVAGAALTIIYGGLCYLGSTLAQRYGFNESQAFYVVEIARLILGNPGKIVLGIIVSLACLTTAIGISSSSGNYFSKISNGKLSYEKVVTTVIIFSFFMSIMGVKQIIQISIPVLMVIYPVLITLILLCLFTKKIENDNVFKFSGTVVFIYSLLEVINTLKGGNVFGFLQYMPLFNAGFGWVLPAIVGTIVGFLVPDKKMRAKKAAMQKAQQ